MPNKIEKSDAEWKSELTPDQYHVLREKGTERAFTGEYDHAKEPGEYQCAGCGKVVFRSDEKFDSGSGWPSFWAPLAGDRIEERPDNKLGMKRVEIVCKRCGSHLGHVFEDGPQPSGERYCVNSLSLAFKKKDEK